MIQGVCLCTRISGHRLSVNSLPSELRCVFAVHHALSTELTDHCKPYHVAPLLFSDWWVSKPAKAFLEGTGGLLTWTLEQLAVSQVSAALIQLFLKLQILPRIFLKTGLSSWHCSHLFTSVATSSCTTVEAGGFSNIGEWKRCPPADLIQDG